MKYNLADENTDPIRSNPHMKGLLVLELIPAATGPIKYGPNLQDQKRNVSREIPSNRFKLPYLPLLV